MTNEFKMRPKAEIGDLVTVSGYGTRVWKVDAYDMNLRFESGIIAEEITYEVVCVDTGEYDLAWHEDITLLEKARGADAYLRKRPDSERYKPGKADKPHIIVSFSTDSAEPPQGTTAKAKARASATDRLLDERNDFVRYIELWGDEDGNFARKIADIDAKLKRIAGGE